MKRLWLGAGVLVLVGLGIGAFAGYRGDVIVRVNTAVLSTKTAIGGVLGGPRAAGPSPVPAPEVPPPAPAPEVPPILQPRTTVLRPTVSPRRPAVEPDDRSVEAAAEPSEPALTVPSGGEPVRAREMLVAPVEVYDANDTDVVPPTLTALHRSTVLLMEFHDDDVRALEIVVNEAGRVEDATVAVRPRTIGEYMVMINTLSAAKAWAFHPATRQGVAVKYRLRVALDKETSWR